MDCYLPVSMAADKSAPLDKAPSPSFLSKIKWAFVFENCFIFLL